MTDRHLHERDDDALRELGKQLPVDRPDRARRESVRASILAAASLPAAPPSRRWLLVGGGFAAGALAAAAIVLLVVRPAAPTASVPAPAHEAYARIESSSAAEIEHTLAPTPTGTDERVRVRSGTVRLAVPPTRPGDRVRVTTGDAEIEGSGAYEVVVAADALAAVTVTSGTATVRLANQSQPVFLAAGQSWRATVQTADLGPLAKQRSAPGSATAAPPPDDKLDNASLASRPPAGPQAAKQGPDLDFATAPGAADSEAARAPRPAVTAPAAPATSQTSSIGSGVEPSGEPRPAVAAPGEAIATGTAAPPPAAALPAENATERHFRAGWSLLRANKLADAIVELAAAADAADGPLAADARYYEAVALIRAKRGAEAERALVRFLDTAPQSTRRGRAAIMLGRLIADRGDAAGAKAWFEAAAKDADPSVAAAAAAALATGRTAGRAAR